jgi:hypothetical protein
VRGVEYSLSQDYEWLNRTLIESSVS